jgi:hypothetical protein
MKLSEMTKEDIRKNPWNMFFYSEEDDIILFVYEVFIRDVDEESILKYIRIYDETEDNMYNDGAGNPQEFWIQKNSWTDDYELIKEEVKKDVIINKRKLLVEKII